MRKVLLESQYMPPIAYFAAAARFEGIVVEKHERYEKQTYRNRCYINTAQGKEVLIVPVTSKRGKPSISEVRIDYSQKWLNNHWRTLQTAYGKAPFFEYFGPELHNELFRRHELLYDLNRGLLTLCLKWLKWTIIEVSETSAYENPPANDITDLRSSINPKKPELVQSFYQPAVYYQVFGNKFVENLSLVDLIFCEGPGAAVIVQASSRK